MSCFLQATFGRPLLSPASAAGPQELFLHVRVSAITVVGANKCPAAAGSEVTAFAPGNEVYYAELLTPRGEIVAIDEPPGMDLLPLKDKSLTWHWELMLTRPLFEPDSTVHREILNEVTRLVDAGRIHTTLTTTLDRLSAANLRGGGRRMVAPWADGRRSGRLPTGRKYKQCCHPRGLGSLD